MVKMEIKDYIGSVAALLSASLVVAGWIFSRYKDREQEKFRLRLSRREELVKSFLVVDDILLRTGGDIDKDPTFLGHWIRFAGLMRLYGTHSENDWLGEFTGLFFGQNCLAAANEARNTLRNGLISSVRSELGFPPLSLD